MDKSRGKFPPGAVELRTRVARVSYWTDEGPDDGSSGALVPQGPRPGPPSLTMEAEEPDSPTGQGGFEHG